MLLLLFENYLYTLICNQGSSSLVASDPLFHCPPPPLLVVVVVVVVVVLLLLLLPLLLLLVLVLLLVRMVQLALGPFENCLYTLVCNQGSSLFCVLFT
jgi:hypothetical protein